MPQAAAIAAHADHRKSWMLPQASKRKAPVYVSDRNSEDVDVYDYTNGQHVGTLTGFTAPRGQCVDAKGDVWIADGSSIVEYAHGGTNLLRRLTSENSHYSCSVARNGDLAVVAENTSSSIESLIEIWPRASGSPTLYYAGESSCHFYALAGYGESGVLYIEANDFPSSYKFYVCDVTPEHQTFNNLTFKFASSLQGNPMWDGTRMTIMVESNYAHSEATVYQVAPAAHGRRLRALGKTTFKDTCANNNIILQSSFLVGKANTPVNRTQAHSVIGVNAYCPDRIEFWHYPAGGLPYKTLSLGSAIVPAADSVSLAP